MAIRLSEDKELVEEIRQKLKENKDKYGEQFCPCVIPTKYESENKEDYICMCIPVFLLYYILNRNIKGI